jgi:hypothetical protein
MFPFPLIPICAEGSDGSGGGCGQKPSYTPMPLSVFAQPDLFGIDMGTGEGEEGGGGEGEREGIDPDLAPHRWDLQAIGSSLQVQIDGSGYRPALNLGTEVARNLSLIVDRVNGEAIKRVEHAVVFAADRMNQLYTETGMVLDPATLMQVVRSMTAVPDAMRRNSSDSDSNSSGSSGGALPDDARRALEAVRGELADRERQIKRDLDDGRMRIDEQRNAAQRECVAAFSRLLQTYIVGSEQQQQAARELEIAHLDTRQTIRLIERHAAGVSSSRDLPMWVWLRARRVRMPARCSLTGTLIAVQPPEDAHDDDYDDGEGGRKRRAPHGKEKGKEEEEAEDNIPVGLLWIASTDGWGDAPDSREVSSLLLSTGSARAEAVLYPPLVEEIVHRTMFGVPAVGVLPKRNSSSPSSSSSSSAFAASQDLEPVPDPRDHGVCVWVQEGKEGAQGMPSTTAATRSTTTSATPPPGMELSALQKRLRAAAAASVRSRRVVPAGDVARIVLHARVKPWHDFARSLPLLLSPVRSGAAAFSWSTVLPTEQEFARLVEALFAGIDGGISNSSGIGIGIGGRSSTPLLPSLPSYRRKAGAPSSAASWVGSSASAKGFDSGQVVRLMRERYSEAYAARNCAMPPRYVQDVLAHFARHGTIPGQPPQPWPETFKRFWRPYSDVLRIAMDAFRELREIKPELFVNPDAV